MNAYPAVPARQNEPADPADGPARPRWERRKDARPHELLMAALDLFVERGFAATRLDDVAARAGVSKGTLYLYFDNKQELFKAVVREHLVPVLDEADALINASERDSAALFRDIMSGWWQRIGETRLSGITKLVMSEAGNFPEIASFYFDEVIQRGNALLERVLQRGVERGEFRDLDVPVARSVLVAPVLMLMMWRHSFGACSMEQLDPQRFMQTLIDVSLHGLLKQ